MCKKFKVKGLLFMFLLLGGILLITMVQAYADPVASAISGRLGAAYDNKTENVTAMVAGYCEGKPVTLGPVTWTVAKREFSDLKAEDVGKVVCGKDFVLKMVTKSANNGKEIVADVVIVRQ